MWQTTKTYYESEAIRTLLAENRRFVVVVVVAFLLLASMSIHQGNWTELGKLEWDETWNKYTDCVRRFFAFSLTPHLQRLSCSIPISLTSPPFFARCGQLEMLTSLFSFKNGVPTMFCRVLLFAIFMNQRNFNESTFCDNWICALVHKYLQYTLWCIKERQRNLLSFFFIFVLSSYAIVETLSLLYWNIRIEHFMISLYYTSVLLMQCPCL